MQIRSLFSNFSWTITGNTVYSGCQWVVIIILAKFVSTQIVGFYSLALAVTTPVILLSQLSLRIVQATDARRGVAFNTYFSLRFYLTALALAAIVIISWAVGKEAAAILIIIMIGAAKSSESISDVCYGLFMQHERMDLMGKSLVIRSVISLGVFFMLVYFMRNAIIGLLGLTLVWVGMFFAYDMPNVRRLDQPERPAADYGPPENSVSGPGLFIPRWDLPEFSGVFILSLPMGLTNVLETLTIYMPRYAIAYYLGESPLGIFTALSYLLLAISLVVSSAVVATVPRLAQYYARGMKRDFAKLLVMLFILISTVCSSLMVVVLVFGQEIISFIYTEQYAHYSYLLAWLMGAGIFMFSGSVLVTALMAMRRFRILMTIGLLSVVSLLGLCIILVPLYGLAGAVWAITINAGIVLVVRIAVMAYLVRKGPPPASRIEGKPA
jgi:O-antigen/teichoic acid export membrane protein